MTKTDGCNVCTLPSPNRPGIKDLELHALYEIANLVGSAMNLGKTLSDALRVLHTTLRMERATLILLDESGEKLTIRASYGLTKKEQQRGVYGLNEGVCGKIFQTGLPFVVPDINSEPLFLNRTQARNHIKKEKISFIGVPILLSDVPAGVLTVDRLFGQEISFEEDIRFLSVVARLIAQFLELNLAIRLHRADLVEENRHLRAELQKNYNRHNIIGQCKVMQEVFHSIGKVAPSSATVLLLGESGTGKELIARAIHNESPRRDSPFIKVNCAALPETLLESELLGHEKGAFTGATTVKKGRFELAHKGTLFLDEIAELSLPLQAKLLRVLQEQQFERLGGTETITVDVRIIAATNRSLDEEVANGLFRADLYYRLNVIPILLPPLRQRRQDIPLLIDHFLRQSNKRNHRKVRLSWEALEFLVEYDWPGNVRELQNLIERLVILTEGNTVRYADLPSYMLAEPEPTVDQGQGKAVKSRTLTVPRKKLSLRDMERQEIEAALRRHGWVQARAARELGLTQRQIGYRIRKYGLRVPGAR